MYLVFLHTYHMVSPTQPSQSNQLSAATTVIWNSCYVRLDIFTKVHNHCRLMGTADAKRGEITEVMVEAAVFLALELAKGLYNNVKGKWKITVWKTFSTIVDQWQFVTAIFLIASKINVLSLQT